MAAAKICGIKDSAALDAAIAGGARFVGLVFFAKSPRHLSFDAAAALAARARGRSEIVAVTVDAPDALLGQINQVVRPDWVQAHGSETPARTASLRQFATKGVVKALGIGRASDLRAARAFETAADTLLFDAKAPPGSQPGGNGAAFDWAILADLRLARPWFLSGGLTPENIGEAVKVSGATLVDVSSGVERAPGLKDPEKIARFLAAARA